MSIATSTDPGTQSAAELEREVDRERERVSDTIGALQSKLSMDNVVEQVARAVSEHGGELGRNLGRAVRDNPLPLILTGVGLVWLMAGSGPRSRYGEDWDDRPSEPYYPREVAREPERGYPGTVPAGFGSTYDEDSYGTVAGGDDLGDDRPGLRERAAGLGEAVADAASGAYEAARDAVSGAGDAARDAVSGAGDAVAGAGRGARRAGGRARDWSGRQAHAMQGRAHGLQDRMQAGAEEHPLVLGGIAFAVGAALGAALPRTRTEDELIGPHADRLKEGARDLARSEADKAMAVAAAVADEGKVILDEATESVAQSVPDGGTLAERGRDAAVGVADRLRGAAETEAERQRLGDPDAPPSR